MQPQRLLNVRDRAPQNLQADRACYSCSSSTGTSPPDTPRHNNTACRVLPEPAAATGESRQTNAAKPPSPSTASLLSLRAATRCELATKPGGQQPRRTAAPRHSFANNTRRAFCKTPHIQDRTNILTERGSNSAGTAMPLARAYEAVCVYSCVHTCTM